MNTRQTAGRSAAGAALLVVSIAACSGGSGPAHPATFTPTPPTTSASSPQGGSRTPSPNQGSTAATAKGSATGKSSAPARTSAPASTSDPQPTRARSSAPAKQTSPATRTHATPSATLAQVPPTATNYPNTAPETGGGGTAGLQDGVLFGAGGAAILLGLATLAYRRRLSRHGRTAE